MTNFEDMKRIAALTMVRNDDFYLRRWTAYYGGQIGEENLYVLLDGKDQPLPDWCPKAHVRACDKVPGQVVESDKRRIDLLSDLAAELFAKGYELVIGCDADEFLVVDPALGIGLAEYLSRVPVRGCLSGLGIDVGQKTDEEGDIREGETFLSQRHYAEIGTRYTKAAVISEPLRWGRGFHRVKGRNFHIGKDLYLFHFGYFDLGRIEARFSDKDREAAGWTRHLQKRSRTIRHCSQHKAREWEPTVRMARALESVCRPPYAWNKPALLGMLLVVRIPERFQSIV